MKRVLFNIFAVIATLFVVMACVKEKPHTPGEPEESGCYGVYFPTQDTKLVLDPEAPTTFEVKVAREVSTGEIIVPVVLTSSEDGVFSKSNLVFADGQSESVLVLDFSGSKVGEQYRCTLEINDPEYAKHYTDVATSIDVSVLREKWNELGPISFIEDYYWGIEVAADHPKAAIIYQNDGDKTMFRLENPFAKRYTNFVDGDDWFTFRVLKKGDILYKGQANYETKITKSDLVFYNDFNTGYTHSSYNAQIYLCHPSGFTSNAKNEEAWSYNKVKAWQENGLPGVVTIAPYYYMYGIGGWNGSGEESIKITFPGFIETDYSIKMEAGLTEEGKVPVSLTLGVDVAKVRFATYEGRLSTAAKNSTIENLIQGKVEGAEEAEAVEDMVLSVACDTTGIYTLVAVTLDKEGEGHVGESVEFTYVLPADAEDNASVLKGGVQYVPTYEHLGYDATNSFQFYLYGEDLTKVYVKVFTAKALLNEDTGKLDVESAVEDMLADEESEPVSAEELKLINTDVWVDLVTGLNPNTDYVFVAYGTNGYSKTICAYPITTDGLPFEKVGDVGFTSEMWGVTDYPMELYLDPNIASPSTYWLYDEGEPWMYHTVDPKTKAVSVPLQDTGVNYAAGMPILKADLATYNKLVGRTDEVPACSISEDGKTITLQVKYFVLMGNQIGSFGEFEETISIADNGASTSSVSTAKLSGIVPEMSQAPAKLLEKVKSLKVKADRDSYEARPASFKANVSKRPENYFEKFSKTAPESFVKIR